MEGQSDGSDDATTKGESVGFDVVARKGVSDGSDDISTEALGVKLAELCNNRSVYWY